jgi:N-terminal domain of anti-restriction factor ArdC
MQTSTTTTHAAIIAESIQQLTAQLAQGNSEALTNYLTAMGRFHSYSFGNQLLIAMQCPDAQRVAGFHAWKDLGPQRQKGCKSYPHSCSDGSRKERRIQ